MIFKLIKNPFFKWLAVIAFIWGIPSAIFWAGIKFYLDDRAKSQNEQLIDGLNHKMERLVYEITPENYFLKPIQSLYSQVRGMPISKEVLAKIISDFERQYPSGFLDISFFNGDGRLIIDRKEKSAYEEYFRLIAGERLNAVGSAKNTYTLASASINLVGSVLPMPDFAIRKVRDRANRIINLGHPNRFSMCYFNNDASISLKYISGILCFMHKEKMSMAAIIEERLKNGAYKDFGYISDEKSSLPKVLKRFSPQDIADFYQQYPTSSFELDNQLITLKRFDGGLILVGAKQSPSQPAAAILICFFIFCSVSILFFKTSYRAMVMQTGFNYTVKQRLVFLFALCYALPFFAAVCLTVLYLSELKRTIYFETAQNNYRRLAEIDSGFTSFVTSRLIDYRKLSKKLAALCQEPSKIKAIMQKEVDDFNADGVHAISSCGVELISTQLTISECRRHQKKSQKEKQLILESWRERNAPLTDNHIQLLMGDDSNINWRENSGYKALWQVFVSTAYETMNYYNESHNKPAIQAPKKNYILASMLESGSDTLFQSAKASIGKFVGVEGFDEIFMGYIDIIAGLNGEAWYGYVFLFDQISLQRQYLTMLFESMASNSDIINRISPEEDIRAVTLNPFAVNFPGVMEFKPFESIIKRGSGQTKAFTKIMKIESKDLIYKQKNEKNSAKPINLEGEECLVTALRGSYLKRYTLIKIEPLSKIDAIFYKRIKSAAAIFAVILIMGFALAKLLVNVLIQPINDIFTGISALALRNYAHRIPIRSKNEFGVLARAFNDSASLLEKLTVSERIKKQLYPENEFRCGSYLITTANSNSRVILSDFYDYFALKQGTYAVMLSEVSGNDISASYLTAILKTAFTLLAPCFPNNPEAILAKLNDFFMPFYRKGHLTTCMLGILDPTNDCITFANAGQAYPVTQSLSDGSQSFVMLPSSPLGISLSTKFKHHVVDIKGKFLVLYSDGAVEAPDKNGMRIGRERFTEIIGQVVKLDCQNPANEILRRLTEITANAPWHDDITVLCIQNRI